MQPYEHLRLLAPRVLRHRADQHSQHVIVMRIQLSWSRRQRDELPRRIGADLTEEGFARRDGAFPEVQVPLRRTGDAMRSEEHTSELQSPVHLVCRLLLEKKKKKKNTQTIPTTKERTKTKK